jgi:hypothetical protein
MGLTYAHYFHVFDIGSSIIKKLFICANEATRN